jgi:NAD+ kinase
VRFERVAIITHTAKRGAEERADEITAYLAERGIKVDDQNPELVVSLGGDGTMLRAAQVAHERDVPMIGINLGALGYLTEVDAGHETEALDRILAGDFEIEERMMLECSTRGKDGDETFVALNEVLVERASRHRLVHLVVTVSGERLASFNADGVIVATPTGSTAYALSAGGPIVSPRTRCLVLVPVSAHMIFSRPFVLAPDETVEIWVDEKSLAAYLSLDGATGCELPPGASVAIRRHERPLRLIRLAGPGFVERLRVKLDLPG